RGYRRQNSIPAVRLARFPSIAQIRQKYTVDRPARPKDDLFDNSTMTFGEHLEELRKSLGKALLWLAVGLVVGLVFFADRVVRYVQEPLKAAIQEYNVDRDLARFGVDPDAPEVQGLR